MMGIPLSASRTVPAAVGRRPSVPPTAARTPAPHNPRTSRALVFPGSCSVAGRGKNNPPLSYHEITLIAIAAHHQSHWGASTMEDRSVKPEVSRHQFILFDPR